MATVKQYVTALMQRQRVIAQKMGCDIAKVDKETRVLNLASVALLAVLAKTLTDKGVITDADLLTVLDAARDDSYPDEPSEPPPNGDN